MIPSALISTTRSQTHSSTDVVTQTDAYNYLNFVINDFWKFITDNNTGFDMYTWTYDAVAGTKDYTLPSPSANTTLLTSTFGIQQLTKIGIKYSSDDTYYKPVSLQYIEGLYNLPDYYATGALKTSPKCVASNTTLSVFPTPTETITNGLQLIGPRLHFPLSASTEDVEGCILIPSQWHYVIIEWLKYRFYTNRGAEFVASANEAKQKYESEKMKAINQMLDRMQESSESFIPDLSFLS